jgi:diguanylate cyclase (GGDEF)-like protein
MSDHTRLTLTLATPPVPAASGAFLLQIHGPDLGSRFTLHEGEIRIGRNADCALDPNSESVSRRHGSIFVDGDLLWIVDHGSTNGTRLNGRRLQVGERAPLAFGDRLQFGDVIFKLLSPGDVEVAYHDELRHLATIDSLTGAYNKRFFFEHLEREVGRSERHGRPLAILLLDIDHFKLLNDTHGHLVGDEVLAGLSMRVQERFLRKEEVLARFGGEEFVIVLPEATRDEALAAAERLRDLIASEPFAGDGRQRFVTVSIGVGCLSETARTVDELLAEADEKLYQAKHQGRNRVGV